MKVVILRPEEHVKETVELFKSNGFEVIAVPFLKIVKKDFDVNLNDFDVVVVTSRTSARILVERGLKHDNVIAIGRKTADELKKIGINPKVPSRFDSKTLYEEFKDVLKNKRVAILRSDKGDPILLKIPNAKEFVLYEIRYNWGDEQIELLKKLDFDAIVFSSRMMVRSFFDLAKELGIFESVVKSLKSKLVIAIGPPTKAELEKFGIEAMLPKEWTFESVVELLKTIKT